MEKSEVVNEQTIPTTKNSKKEVVKIFDRPYEYHFKVLYILIERYTYEWPVNKNGEWAHKRKDVETQPTIVFGFCRACKLCNIRTKKQYEKMKIQIGETKLDKINVNLDEYLKDAPKKQFQENLRIAEKNFEDIFKPNYIIQWIIKYGTVINCLCNENINKYVYNFNEYNDVDDYIYKGMDETKFGMVDYHNRLILVDNINLHAINQTHINANNFGRAYLFSDNDKNYRALIQLNNPNTNFRDCPIYTDEGEKIHKIKFVGRNKYLEEFITDENCNFTITPALKIECEGKREKMINTKFLTSEKIN